jgi:hypothetical protein
VKPVSRFDGVNIIQGATHVCYMKFDETVFELDINSLWVEIEFHKNRRFKLLSIENYLEFDKYLALWLQETGFVKKGTET